MKPTLLAEKELKEQLALLQGWSREGNAIRKTVKLGDFVHAMGFVNSVALIAERANHHPDINIRWNKISLSLSTHSEGGITEKDIALAKKIESLAAHGV